MTRKAPRSGSIAPPIDYSPSGAALDHDPIRLNRIMIASFCWSMISGQTLRVCPEGKPVPTFPDHALKAARLVELGLKRGKGPPPPVFRFDCAPDHISVANPALFISHRTSPQSGPLGKAVQRSCSAWAALFF